MSSQVAPASVLAFLNQLFSMFDRLADDLGLERVKTIGDAYMAVAGIPRPAPDHAAIAATFALAVRDEVVRWHMPTGARVVLRIGLHSGPVIAGVVGQARPHYDLWGDVVNVASRMESQAQPGTIQITSALRQRLSSRFRCEARGSVDVRGRGAMDVFLLLDRDGPSREGFHHAQ